MSASDVNSEKTELRRKVLAGRAAGHDCGHAHSQLLIDFSWEQLAKRIACYISFGDEPSTNVFLKHCQLDEKIELFVPRVVGDELEWVLFSEDQIRHPLGMNEPSGDPVDISSVDLMVIPALALDRAGNRLGRGRGYYDRALAKIDAKNVVALVHDEELVDEVPVEGHDASVNFVCTCSAIVTI